MPLISWNQFIAGFLRRGCILKDLVLTALVYIHSWTEIKLFLSECVFMEHISIRWSFSG